MKRAAAVVVSLWALVCALHGGAAAAAGFVDDAGRRVDLSQPPRRIVTLAPNLVEFVHAVGAGDTLVGTVSFSDYPDAAKSVPRVGDYQRLDVERILALKPDLVLAWQHGNATRELAQIEAAGLKVFHLEPKRLDDVPRALERLGALLGREAAGRERAAGLRRELDALRRAHATAEPVTVFYQVWRDPLMTLNREHLVSDVIALCGGRNVFAGLPQLVPQLSTESVVAADPEVMLTADEQPLATATWRRDPIGPALAPWARYARLTSVRRAWMFTLSGDLISRQGPRIAQGAAAVCEVLDRVREERLARR
jgi:iron complex transport system substrate-binding protein